MGLYFKSQIKTLLSTAFIACTFTTSALAIGVSTSDLWEVTPGTNAVTSNSQMGAGTNADNMFGNTGGAEPNAIFSDSFTAGTVHFVEWQTTSAFRLHSFVLNAAHDGGIDRRRMSQFRLFGFRLGQFEQIFEVSMGFGPYAPVPGTRTPNFISGFQDDSAGNALSFGIDFIVPKFETDRFRAEFVQAQNGIFQGPRIIGLDGFGEFQQFGGGVSAVPLPAALPLYGTGLAIMGFVGWRRRRKVASTASK